MRLLNIEGARGLAAMAVVIFHAMAGMTFLYDVTDPTGLTRYGEHGVDFFFVLSGFIITHVHARDLGQSTRFRPYVTKRIVRLFPLIWMVTIPWMILRAVSGNWTGSAEVVMTSLLLVPSDADPMPVVLWTLRHEVMFYAVFGLLILYRPVAIWLVAVWIVLCVGQLAHSLDDRPVEGLAAFFLSAFNLQFLLGAGVGLLHGRMRFEKSIWPFLAGIAVVALVFAVEGQYALHRTALDDYTSRVATGWVLVLGLAFAMLLHGILCLPARATPPRVLVLLGSASFAIYLVHVPAITVLQRLLVLLPDGWGGMAAGYVVLVAGSAGAGILLHLALERPVTGRLRHLLLRPASTAYGTR